MYLFGGNPMGEIEKYILVCRSKTDISVHLWYVNITWGLLSAFENVIARIEF